MPSVWEVVSAYLHSGTAAVEAAADPVRGSSNDRVAQVRCLLDKIDADGPKVERGSTRDALRQLFAETEVAGRSHDTSGHRPVDLSSPSPPPGGSAAVAPGEVAPGLAHLPPPPRQGAPAAQAAQAAAAHATEAPVARVRPAAPVAPVWEAAQVEPSDRANGRGDVDADVVIDLRDGADPFQGSVPDRFERVSPGAPEVLRRPIQKYGTVRRDTIDDAVVRWYKMRHGTRPASSQPS